jgi:hypothetical protein
MGEWLRHQDVSCQPSAPAALTPKKEQRNPMDRGLFGPKSWSGRCVEEKNPSLAGIETPSSSSHYTELSRLQTNESCIKISDFICWQSEAIQRTQGKAEGKKTKYEERRAQSSTVSVSHEHCKMSLQTLNMFSNTGNKKPTGTGVPSTGQQFHHAVCDKCFVQKCHVHQIPTQWCLHCFRAYNVVTGNAILL